MRDDFLTRDWADHHHDASDGIAQLLAVVGTALARLHAIQYDAPWKREPAIRDERC